VIVRMATQKKKATKQAKKAAAKGKRAGAKRHSKPATAGVAAGLVFNHAMIYVRDVAHSLAFYRDALGFHVVDEYPGGYARLRAPRGDATIALHSLEPDQQFAPANEGMRLYFECEALDKLCANMIGRGVEFTQLPTKMPWGWKHAYLLDPDGHEISLYWAGPARLQKTRLTRDH
jgi:catechol 2,3-dioxygenase-like lactoylglutathione lyase family enzyme